MDELAALADGRLDPARRAEVEARVAADPQLAAALERQRAAVRAIAMASGQVRAPHDLRLRIDAISRAPRRRPLWVRLAPSLGLAACLLVAVAVGLGGGGLTVEEALAVSTRPPLAAVAVDPRDPKLLRERVEGLPFPNYAQKFGWLPEGSRRDAVDDRGIRTVFYVRAGVRIAYSIVGGDALDPPEDARAAEREGTALRVFEHGGRTAVTWERRGHTCVLSGEDVPATTLLELAAWKGMGSIPF